MKKPEIVGCPVCKGRKTQTGLGSMIENCNHCKGIGWIEKPLDLEKEEDILLNPSPILVEIIEAPVNDSLEDVILDSIPKKKSGRPKKNAEG